MNEKWRLQEYARAYYRHPKRIHRWDLSQPGNAIMDRERRQLRRQLCLEAGVRISGESTILDIGCGSGEDLRRWLEEGAVASNLAGIDIAAQVTPELRQSLPDIDFREGDAAQLPWAPGSFDVVQCSTIFSSILDESMAREVLVSAWEAVRPRGVLLIYDYRIKNPFNSGTRAVPPAMLIGQIKALAPGLWLQVQRCTVLPPLTRLLGPVTEWLYPWLTRLSFLHTHYWIVARKA